MDGGGNDDDANVDVSNLHRQIAHNKADARNSGAKPTALASALRQHNARLNAVTHDSFITQSNGVDDIAWCSVVLYCMDSVGARHVIGGACVAVVVTMVSGAAIGLNGQMSVHVPPPPPSPVAASSQEAATQEDDHGNYDHGNND